MQNLEIIVTNAANKQSSAYVHLCSNVRKVHVKFFADAGKATFVWPVNQSTSVIAYGANGKKLKTGVKPQKGQPLKICLPK